MLDTRALKAIQRIVGPGAVLHAPEDLIAFEYDSTPLRGLPDAAVFPQTTEQVAAAVRLARSLGLPLTARGAGTGLSGGSVPAEGGIILALTRLNRIIEIDAVNRLAVVEPGVVNLQLDRAARACGLFFAPDPASQRVCTIGGNIAENAGGPHCLAGGVTSNHVLGLEMVLADGSVVEAGGRLRDLPGYDLAGLVTGSEGTLCVVTRAVVRLLPVPETGHTLVARFPGVQEASNAVSAVIAAGIVPQCLEMSDEAYVRVAHEALGNPGEPPPGAQLLVEVEGLAETVAEYGPRISAILAANGATSVDAATDQAERDLIWSARRSSSGALGRIGSDRHALDVVVPRTRLPEAVSEVGRICSEHGLRVATVLHAGDGNLHPNLFFAAARRDEVERALAAADAIVRLCAAMGGSITGEHGVGHEKRDHMRLMFNEADLAAMTKVRAAFAADILNPGKLFPCSEP